MSSKPAEPRSIASQLVLLFTPAAAILLGCGLAILYFIVVRHSLEEDRAVLQDKLFAIRADLKRSVSPQALGDQLKTVRAGEKSTYWVRIMDNTGRVAAETPGMKRSLPPEIFARSDPPQQTDWGPKDYRSGGRLFSLVSAHEEVGGQNYLIQIAQDRSEDENFTLQFGFLVAGVLLAGIIASALIALTVAKRGLQPLAAMTQSLKRVGPHRFHERVPPAEWPRELQPVAVAFDDMLDRLEDSFTRLSQFSADIAHELRTPVANIRGEAEVALTRPRSPNEYEAVIESSIAECARLSGIIDNLLFLARAEAAESQVHRSTFDGRAAIEKIATYNEAIAAERHLEISCRGKGEVFADPVLFGRAVSNLVDNAVRFTPEGGRITISLSTKVEGAEIVVTDTGCGIAAEHIPRVFDRFYRVDPSRSTEGTGLGLALVKSIAELHGGSVTILSELNRGTSITLKFPRSTGVSGT